MNFFTALTVSLEGHSIKSVVSGKVYTPEVLNVSDWNGSHFASYSTAGISREETKGDWFLVIPQGT